VVYLLDYVAGNIRSLVNAIEKLGYTVEWIRSPEDVARADVRMQAVSGSIDAITFISKYLASFC
jgi:imidazoleglycerol phosphate synthase glutamine amidotransferase subunit HisH